MNNHVASYPFVVFLRQGTQPFFLPVLAMDANHALAVAARQCVCEGYADAVVLGAIGEQEHALIASLFDLARDSHRSKARQEKA
ncbi:MAG: hypothetical protein ABN502_01920 [Gammaproteobacteria bacterium]